MEKIMICGFFCLITLFGSNVYSAPNNLHYADRLKSLSIADLLTLAKKHDPFAVSELGIRKEKSALSVLENIVNESDAPTPAIKDKQHLSPAEKRALARAWSINTSHKEARIALARLGEEKYLSIYIVGLSTTNGAWRAECIDALGEIGDRRTAKYLIPILDDYSAPPDSTDPPYSLIAQGALSDILPDAFKALTAKQPGHRPSRQDWELWLKQNPVLGDIK